MTMAEKSKRKGRYPEMVELKRFLHKKNITYRELSEMIGISLDAANNKLNGYTDFNKHEMIIIYKALELTPIQFIKVFGIEG